MTRFVLDASVTLSWLIDHSTAPYATRIRQLLSSGSYAVVPALWQWEIANGFVIAERRGILAPVDTAHILQTFEAMLSSIEIRQDLIPIHRIIKTAVGYQLTVYDAAYLELAKEERLPIATLDHALAKAAAKAAVPLIQ